jgi:hypothetical protein
MDFEQCICRPERHWVPRRYMSRSKRGDLSLMMNIIVWMYLKTMGVPGSLNSETTVFNQWRVLILGIFSSKNLRYQHTYIYIYYIHIIHMTWAIKRPWEDCNDQHNSQHHAMVPKRLCAQAKIWLASAIFLVMSFLDTYSQKKPFSIYIDILYIYIILYQYRYIFGGVFVSTEFPIFWYILVNFGG